MQEILRAISSVSQPGDNIHVWSPYEEDGRWAHVCKILDIPNKENNRKKLIMAWKVVCLFNPISTVFFIRLIMLCVSITDHS